MSTGEIIGGIAGGVIGWFAGGPYGAWVGFTIGFGIGGMIDPLIPDTQQAGQPLIGDLVVTTANEGQPLPDILGTPKTIGNIVWYCCDRSAEITEEQEVGGKGGGGSQTVVTGYQYHLTWAEVICLGPIDTLYTIYAGDDVVWEGALNRPGSGGEETITLENMGSATFYFGTDDQMPNSTIGSKLDDSTLNIPYRNQCWIFYNDCKIGASQRSPTMKYIVRKSPTVSGLSDLTKDINTYDYNPAHASWYVINTMAGLPATYLDSTSFSGVASTLSNEEGGISILFNQQQPADRYLDTIFSHSAMILRPDSDGKFHLKLLRDDTSVSGMQTIVAADDLVGNYEFTRKSWIDTTNEVKVQYSQRVITVDPCDIADPFQWSGDNPQTINPSDSAVVTVSGGVGPFTWTVLSGTGAWAFDDEQTTERTNTILTGPDACGSAQMQVVDSCNTTTSGWIRSTDGQWNLKHTAGVIGDGDICSGGVTCEFTGGDSTITVGYQRWVLRAPCYCQSSGFLASWAPGPGAKPPCGSPFTCVSQNFCGEGECTSTGDCPGDCAKTAFGLRYSEWECS